MDPRKILDVSANATASEVQRAYREKSAKHHPDQGGDAWAFQQVHEAYRQLMKQLQPGTAIDHRVVPGETPRSPEASAAPNSASGSSTSTSASQPPQRPSQHESATIEPRSGSGDSESSNWQRVLKGQLPLQSETTVFIFVNVLDIFMTYIILRFEGMEANPIARFFLDNWNIQGLIWFKLAIVAFVCVIAQVVATRRFQTGRWLLNIGSLIVGCVVIYSVSLFVNRIL